MININCYILTLVDSDIPYLAYDGEEWTLVIDGNKILGCKPPANVEMDEILGKVIVGLNQEVSCYFVVLKDYKIFPIETRSQTQVDAYRLALKMSKIPEILKEMEYYWAAVSIANL